ncbi:MULTISPECIES: hypothetical protein [unclassified Erwinia]|uniref:hypothetical protein n=1 Tax=Erwinia TaxID=551 RepID=UPI00082980A9|nr:hypothetical protein [Erwinia sp. ErVv1]
MFKFLRALFSSPELLLQVMSQRDIEESIEDGERILIDEDGTAAVNLCSKEVKDDFARHVNALKRA